MYTDNKHGKCLSLRLFTEAPVLIYNFHSVHSTNAEQVVLHCIRNGNIFYALYINNHRWTEQG